MRAGSLSNWTRRSMSSVALNCRAIEPAGQAPDRLPLVLVHGLFGSSSNFRQVARLCSQRLSTRVLLPDLRNHGSSPWSNDCSFESMASDLMFVLDREHISRAWLCGHSLGGKAVMAASLMHPDRVAGMLSVDIAPAEYSADSEDWRMNQESAPQSLPECMGYSHSFVLSRG